VDPGAPVERSPLRLVSRRRSADTYGLRLSWPVGKYTMKLAYTRPFPQNSLAHGWTMAAQGEAHEA